MGGLSEQSEFIEVESQVAVYGSDSSIPVRLIADSGSGYPLFIGAKKFDELVLKGNKQPSKRPLSMETFHCTCIITTITGFDCR